MKNQYEKTIKDWSYDGIMDEILNPKELSFLACIKNKLKRRINSKMGRERLTLEKV